MIEFDSVTFTYQGSSAPVLRQVDLAVSEGDLAVVIGPTGSGKSTLLKTINGLVPRFTGGTLKGRVTVDGRDTARVAVRDMAGTVGLVPQQPATGFVTDTVEAELAYTMEQMGLDPGVMRKRVEEVLDLLGLAPLRHRRLAGLSGGEAQRVAIGAVFTAHPRVMVLDEPTSALDPAAAEEVLGAVTRLVHDLGVTVMMAEHRLERVVQYADSLVELHPDGTVTAGEPKTILETAAVAPPIVHLGRWAGWSPLPLTIRDARRLGPGLLARLPPPPDRPSPGGAALLEVDRLTVTFGGEPAVRQATFGVAAGEVVALMGRNGAGKSSLLWAIQGSGPRAGGRVSVGGTDPARLPAHQTRRLVGLVGDEPSDLLFMESVAEECARVDRLDGTPPGATARLADRITGGIDPSRHPADLSEGQKLGLVLAIQLNPRPRLVLLDEPTRGLDYAAKARLAGVIGELASTGTAVIVATHDVEFAAEVSTRVMVAADGEIVADGPTAEVVTYSPVFAPQVAKVLGKGWLTPAEVAAAMGATP